MSDKYDIQSPLDFAFNAGSFNNHSSTNSPKSKKNCFSGSGLIDKTIYCPTCGESLTIKLHDSKIIGCNSCGSSIDLSSHKVIGTNLSDIKTDDNIKLGMILRFKGIKYQIIGKITFTSTIDETYEESTDYLWDEWMLISRKGKVSWLIKYGDDFFLLNSFRPSLSIDIHLLFSSEKDSFQLGEETISIYNKGKAKILSIEGEINWSAKINSSITYIDAKSKNIKFSCKYFDKESHFFKGHHYTPEQIYAMFRIKSPYIYRDIENPNIISWNHLTGVSVSQKQVIKPTPPKITEALKILFRAGILFIIIGHFFSSNGVPVENSFVMTTRGSPFSKTFELKEKGKVYAIKGWAELSGAFSGHHETWVWLSVVLLKIEKDKKMIPKIIFENEYWREDGNDGGDHWIDFFNEGYEYFILDEPGKYRLRLTGRNKSGHSDTICTEIRKDVVRRDYITYFGIFFLIISILGYFKGNYLYNLYAQRQSSD